jgi:hypothetical protein
MSCLFAFNHSANEGGAIAGWNRSESTILNCTFYGNTAASSGGALYNWDRSYPLVENSIFWNNPPVAFSDFASPATIGFSNLEDGLPENAVDMGGNISAPPQFVRLPDPGHDGTWGTDDDAWGDLRLESDSPCINQGDPNYDGSGVSVLDEHPRVLCDHVDMGAYEFGIGDFDCNLYWLNLLTFPHGRHA